MTIVASVKVRDGLILGTDSMTQISSTTEDGNVQVLKAYSNARKLFQIQDKPIGVMTYGLGNVGGRSIEGLVLDFCSTAEAGQDTVEAIAQALYTFCRAQYDVQFAEVDEAQRPAFGIFVAGYSEAQPFPEEFEFLLPRDAAAFAPRPADSFGASWRGIDLAFTRLLRGFDPRIAQRLEESGWTAEQVGELLRDLETPVIIDGMPVQDAVNFAVYILETTIGWTQFQIGAPTCGPPLQVATVLPDEGFAWVARPELRA